MKQPMKLNSLSEVIKLLNSRHNEIRNLGVTAFKYTNNNGSFKIFEEIRGWKITEIKEIDNSSILVRTLNYAISTPPIINKKPVDNSPFITKPFSTNGKFNTFQSEPKAYSATISSNMYLNDLLSINIYEHSAEFISNSSNNFIYIIESPLSQKIALNKMVKNPFKNVTQKDNLVAFWSTNKNYFEDMEDILDSKDNHDDQETEDIARFL